jgi:protein-S-isoprenylcysteine O-methyltransferase Ste14
MVWFVLLFVGWGVLHSVLAALGLKGWFYGRFGERAYAGWYRLLYNLLALLTFLPLYLLIPVLMPVEVLWQWQRPYLYLALGMQLLGLVGLAYALWVTDVWHFLGLRQLVAYWRHAEQSVPEPHFTAVGPYALVRHPLYLFSLMVLWFNPVVTVGNFVFYLLVTAYFWLGSVYEERKLVALYGEAYVAYQRRTPRLLPGLRRNP